MQADNQEARDYNRIKRWLEIGDLVVSFGFLIALLVTGWTNGLVKHHVAPGHGLRALLVTLSYFSVLAVLYAARFFLYEHWIFSGRSRVRAALRSRRQVWSAARANRTP